MDTSASVTHIQRQLEAQFGHALIVELAGGHDAGYSDKYSDVDFKMFWNPEHGFFSLDNFVLGLATIGAENVRVGRTQNYVSCDMHTPAGVKKVDITLFSSRPVKTNRPNYIYSMLPNFREKLFHIVRCDCYVAPPMVYHGGELTNCKTMLIQPTSFSSMQRNMYDELTHNGKLFFHKMRALLHCEKLWSETYSPGQHPRVKINALPLLILTQAADRLMQMLDKEHTGGMVIPVYLSIIANIVGAVLDGHLKRYKYFTQKGGTQIHVPLDLLNKVQYNQLSSFITLTEYMVDVGCVLKNQPKKLGSTMTDIQLYGRTNVYVYCNNTIKPDVLYLLNTVPLCHFLFPVTVTPFDIFAPLETYRNALHWNSVLLFSLDALVVSGQLPRHSEIVQKIRHLKKDIDNVIHQLVMKPTWTPGQDVEPFFCRTFVPFKDAMMAQYGDFYNNLSSSRLTTELDALGWRYTKTGQSLLNAALAREAQFSCEDEAEAVSRISIQV